MGLNRQKISVFKKSGEAPFFTETTFRLFIIRNASGKGISF